MRFSLSVALLAFLLPLVAHCTTVFISKTCREKKNWKEYWENFRQLSEEAPLRMASQSDTDFEMVFRYLVFSRVKSPDLR
jgi:hypothetical protein